MPNISVIVPCHNSSLYLKNCLDHLIAQIDSVDLEIILVDDASTDDGKTIAIMKEYEEQYPDRIMIIELSENLRQGGARNVGISYSSGEYIAFCDSDDWIVNGGYKALYDIAKRTEADEVEFDNTYVYDTVKSEMEEELEKQIQNSSVPIANVVCIDSSETRKENLFRKNSTLCHSSKLYRGSLIRDNSISFPAHVTMEEPAFTLMVRFLESKYVRVNFPFYFYYLHENSTINGTYEKQKMDNAITHLYLYDHLFEKAFFNDYLEEIQYLFWYWYFLNTILFAVTRDVFFAEDELLMLQNNTKRIAPNIGSNPYFKKLWGEAIPELASITYIDIESVGLETLKEIFTKLNGLCN